MKKLFFMLSSMFMFMSMVYAQDTTRQQVKDQNEIQNQDRVHQEEHLIYKDGKLYSMQQGVQFQIKNQIMLNNGMVVNPNGSYRLKIREIYQLRNGECIDMNGYVYQNQQMFNERRIMDRLEMQKIQDKIINKTPADGTKKLAPVNTFFGQVENRSRIEVRRV